MTHHAFIAGATGYTGQAVVRTLRAQGIATTAHVRPDSPRLAEHTETFEALGAEVLTVACDVASEEDTVAAVKTTLDRFGRIDSCFANAGFGHGANPLKLEMSDWRRLMATNLDGVFLSFRETARHMVERGGGGKSGPDGGGKGPPGAGGLGAKVFVWTPGDVAGR